MTSSAVMKQGGKPRKMVRADTPAQLDELFASVRASGFRFLVQEYVPGGDDELQVPYLPRREARGARLLRRQEIRMYPRDAGVSTYLELVREPKVVELGMQVLRSLDFVGV